MAVDAHSWVIIDDVIVSISRPGPIPMELWESYLRDMNTKGVKRCLAASSGGAVEVNSLQRKMVVQVLVARGIAVAGVTDDRLVRGLITALAWMGANIKAFSWAQLQEALEFLQVPPARSDAVIQALATLRKAAGQSG